METGIRHTHLLVVILFLLIYIIKTYLLLTNNNEKLESFTKKVKVPEMIISTLFLATGIYMLTQLPEVNNYLIIKIVAVFLSIPLAIIGFKKKNKALAAISLLLLISAYVLAEVSKNQKPKAMESLSSSNIDGKEIFDLSCVSCHGSDGKLGLMGASDLTQSKLEKDACINIIKNGKGAMKSFSNSLSEEQILSVSDYIQTLKHN